MMKTGEIVETGVVSEIFRAPKAAYTRHLLESEPKGRKPPVSPDAPVVLDVKDLRVTFHQPVGFLGRKRQIRALDGVSLTLRQGQTLAVVGESGAGKSTVGKAILQLTKCQGEITFLGKEIDTGSRAGMRAFRRNMQVVFQDPYGALSPRMSIGEFITEPLLVHRPELSKKQRYDIASRLLSEVSLDPGHVFRYPHEFSGGQRQRIAIARAIVLEPVLVILDEPTSALDVSVQVQVIDLLRSLQARRNLTFIFISHDLKVVRALADEIIIMKDGRIVESGPTESIIENPTTDYARKLLAAAFDLTA